MLQSLHLATKRREIEDDDDDEDDDADDDGRCCHFGYCNSFTGRIGRSIWRAKFGLEPWVEFNEF